MQMSAPADVLLIEDAFFVDRVVQVAVRRGLRGSRVPSEAGAPISSVIAAARSPARFWYSRAIRCRTASRSSRLVCDQVANALRAALTALSTSAAEAERDLAAHLLGRGIDDIQGLRLDRIDPVAVDVEL